MSIIHLAILGALSVLAGTCLIFASWLGSRSGTAAAMRPAQHRADDGTGGGNLAPAPVEVIRIPPAIEGIVRRAAILGPPGEQERSEEWPRVETPVVHVEATEEPTVEGAIGTMAEHESPEMADAVWRHDWDQRWTALLVSHAQRPDWLVEFGAESLQLPEYRRLVLEHTGEISMADLLAEAKAGAHR